jgi:predicted transcriptional regulator
MAGSTVIIRVEDELKDAFVRAAKADDRSTSQLVRDFMRDYVRRRAEQSDYADWLSQKVEAGRKAIRQGRVKPDKAVEPHFARRRGTSLRKVDKAGL